MMLLYPALFGQSERETVYELDPFSIRPHDTNEYQSESTVGAMIALPQSELPIAVETLTADFIEDTANFKVEDVLRYAAGVGLAERNEFGSEVYSIRGFVTRNLLRNGINMNTPTDTSNIERVEVVKGPNSILYGLTNPGGLVNYITKKPIAGTRFGSIALVAGSYDTYRLNFDFNSDLYQGEQNGLHFRISGSYRDEGSFRSNEHLEGPFVNPVIEYRISPKSKLNLDFTFQKQRGRINRMPTPFLPDYSDFAPAPPDFTHVTSRDTWDAEFKMWDVRFQHEFAEGITLNLSYGSLDKHSDQFAFMGGLATTMSPQIKQLYAGLTGMLLEGNHWVLGWPNRQVSSEARDTVSANLLIDKELFNRRRHRILLGYRWQEIKTRDWGLHQVALETPPFWTFSGAGALLDPSGALIDRMPVLGGPYTTLLPNDSERFSGFLDPTIQPSSPNVVPALGTSFLDPLQREENWGVYITDHISMMEDRLYLLLGLRYSDISQIGQKTSDVAPQAGLVRTLSDYVSIYAMYSESFNPNGRSDTTDPQSAFFPPEKGQSTEVGLKFFRQDKRFDGNLALFEIKRKDARHVGFGGEELQGINTAVLVEEETSKGIEFFGHYNPSDRLTFQFAFSHLDAEVTGPESSSPFYGPGQLVGLPLEGAAENAVSILGKYLIIEGPLKGVECGIGVNYRKGPIQQFGTFDRRFIQQKDDIVRYDLFIGYQTKINRYDTSIRLNVQNATDEVYRDRRGQFAEPVRGALTTKFEF